MILSWKEYTKANDVWSVGCLFAELLVRRPFFQGKDYIHQVMRITEVLGTPPEVHAAHCQCSHSLCAGGHRVHR